MYSQLKVLIGLPIKILSLSKQVIDVFSDNTTIWWKVKLNKFTNFWISTILKSLKIFQKFVQTFFGRFCKIQYFDCLRKSFHEILQNSVSIIKNLSIWRIKSSFSRSGSHTSLRPNCRGQTLYFFVFYCLIGRVLLGM